MNIADRIQHLRKAKGISQEELADRIGVSRQAVSKWESEQSVPDVEKIILLSDYFETTTDYLLKGIEPEKESGRKWNTELFSIAGTALNAAGLVLAVCIWVERQMFYAVGVGIILMLLGTGIFLAGQMVGGSGKERARELFYLPNVWILTAIPLAVFFGTIQRVSGYLIPFPRSAWAINLLSAAAFCVVYFVLGIAVDLAVIKKRRARDTR